MRMSRARAGDRRDRRRAGPDARGRAAPPHDAGVLRQPEAAVAVPAQRPATGRLPPPAARARSPLAARQRLELAHLLERVDAHLRVAADRQPHARVAVAQRRAGTRRRGCPRSSGTRRPWSQRRRAARRRPPITWIPWIDARPRPEEARCCSSSSIGEQPCSARHSSSSRRCSCAWTWRTSPCARRTRRSPPASRAARRARCARRRRRATPSRPRGPGAQRVDPLQERLDVGSQKRRWPGSGGRSARPSRRGDRRRAAARSRSPAATAASRDRDRHRVGLLVRRSVGPVVDVVELAHRAVAGRRHLGVNAPRDRAHRLGVELARQRGTSRCATTRSRRGREPAARRVPRRPRWNACECALGIAATVARYAVNRPSMSSIASRPRAPPRRRRRGSTCSCGRVADARGVADQHHRRGQRVGQHARVVAGEAHDLGGGAGQQRPRQRQPRPQVLGERGRVGVRGDPDRQLDASALGSLARDPGELRAARLDLGAVERPRVDPQPHVRRGSWSARWARRAAARP